MDARIWEWVEQTFPKDTGWQDPQFHCFKGVPVEIAMIPAHSTLEYNVGNGGWSQVLWNCFGCWRQLLHLSEEGYRLIGATDQAEAIKELRRQCERDEAECLRFMKRAEQTKDFSYFGKFTSRSYGATGNDWEDVFFDDSGVYEKRLAWLAEHEKRVIASLSVGLAPQHGPECHEQNASRKWWQLWR